MAGDRASCASRARPNKPHELTRVANSRAVATNTKPETGKGRLSMPALEIIGAPQSNYVWAVRMVCEEKSVAYEHRPERPHTPDVDAIHPFGKIPVMRHGD